MKEKKTPWFLYPLLVIAGVVVLIINSKIEHPGVPMHGEYYYSNLLRGNYSYLSGSLFFLVGLVAGYAFNAHPLITGISLIAIYPVVAIFEATVFKGSHNLIPLEFIVHLLFALPGVVGTLLGRLIKRRVS